MTSMTGYGRAERSDEAISATVEVKSVNNRYLDVNVSLPGPLSSLEPLVREATSAAVTRGRVEVYVRVRELQEELSVTVDRLALAGYLTALNELREAARLEEPVGIAHLLSLEGVLKTERIQDQERYWQIVQPILGDALTQFRASRDVEGQKLETDIMSQLGRVAETVAAITAHAPEIERQVRDNLQRRFADVVGDAVEETRMLAEVAIQLTRFSINEEIVRLNAHLESFREAVMAGGAVGKKMDFLCQEINREINTIGSKSVVLAVNQQVVEAKDALENIREQLRNVE